MSDHFVFHVAMASLLLSAACNGAVGGASPHGTPASCTPACATRRCGPDGCGGSCGACSSGPCSASGQCVSSTDPAAPSAPGGLFASSVTSTSFTLSWSAASDNVAVTGYEVFKDGAAAGTTSERALSLTGLSADTTYSMTVKARDDAGNWSAPSAALSVTTSSGSSGGFPDASNTGVPASTVLTDYTGPCTITVDDTVIDAKTVNCDLTIRARNVTISRTKINGTVGNDGGSFTITDSHVDVGDRAGTGIGEGDFKAIRVHVQGGNRSMHCRNCEIRDCFVHDQMHDETGYYHESGIRMSQNAVIVHNTILCDAPTIPPDAGCSADLTGYGDFEPVQNNLIQGNLFKATTGGTCAYGGSSAGKPYPDANNIRFIDNVFERGTTPSDHGTFVCGYYFPITAFDTSAPGNVWSNNRWDDGGLVEP